MNKTALLSGATGLIGSALLPMLLASDRYARVVVVGRRAVALNHPKLSQVITDLGRLDAVAAELRADDVYCCLGTTIKQAGSQAAFYQVDFKYVVALARLSAAGGAAQFLVVSSLGADAGSGIYYSRVKGEMEQAVRALSFRALHIFRPSLLLGERAQPRLGERVAAFGLALFRPLLVGNLRQYRPVTVVAVAQAMLAAATTEVSGARVHSSETL